MCDILTLLNAVARFRILMLGALALLLYLHLELSFPWVLKAVILIDERLNFESLTQTINSELTLECVLQMEIWQRLISIVGRSLRNLQMCCTLALVPHCLDLITGGLLEF